MPGFGVVVHRGRRSGRLYQTPVNVFATEDGHVLALTDGPDTGWTKNVLAARGCELRTRGRAIRLTSPRLFHDEARRGIRPLERQVLRVTGIAGFLSLKTVPGSRATGRLVLSIAVPAPGRDTSVTLCLRRRSALTIRIRRSARPSSSLGAHRSGAQMWSIWRAARTLGAGCAGARAAG
jgi:deazaflavin-dependent oxidoreductase (nitroreductase family)